MLSVNPSAKELWLSTKNSSMNNPNVKLKKYSLLMIDLCSLLILEDVNLRNSVVEELEPESKSLTDENILSVSQRLSLFLSLSLREHPVSPSLNISAKLFAAWPSPSDRIGANARASDRR